MEISKALRFVQGAIAKKDFNPILTHFYMQPGKIVGCNGRMTIGCDIDSDISAAPKGDALLKAIRACKGTVSIHMTKAKRLAVKADSFKAYIECLDEELYPSLPVLSTPHIPVNGDLYGLLKELDDFVGIDASRIWSNSILITPEGSAYAGNNIILIERFIGDMLPIQEPLCIPYDIINEIVRLKENPTSIQVDEKGMMFHFGEDKWIHTVLRIESWPVQVFTLFPPYEECPAIPENFGAALETLRPFVNEFGFCYFMDGEIRTADIEGAGASIPVQGLPNRAAFALSQLQLVEKVATTANFSNWPNPCPFYGKMLRGLVVGVHHAF